MFSELYIFTPNMEVVQSPLTGGEATYVMQLTREELISKYKQEFDLNIDYLLNDIDVVKLFQCEDTGYRFFHPLNLAGDGPFYEKLEKYPWYYAQNKWDYSNVLKYIDNSNHVLDVGCGEGNFLIQLKEKGIKATGLELNEHAIKSGIKRGLEIHGEMVQDHVANNTNKYDVVCFYQVLEHINDVKSFLESAIAVTKPGGKVIIAVPNNYPYFLKTDQYHTLNWPPHHMGWWNNESLSNLTKVFPLELLSIETEPLQHIGTYTNNFLMEKVSSQLLRSLLKPFVKIYYYLNRKSIPGASIMAIYQKK